MRPANRQHARIASFCACGRWHRAFTGAFRAACWHANRNPIAFGSPVPSALAYRSPRPTRIEPDQARSKVGREGLRCIPKIVTRSAVVVAGWLRICRCKTNFCSVILKSVCGKLLYVGLRRHLSLPVAATNAGFVQKRRFTFGSMRPRTSHSAIGLRTAASDPILLKNLALQWC